jgi:hypothetical protein
MNRSIVCGLRIRAIARSGFVPRAGGSGYTPFTGLKSTDVGAKKSEPMMP